MAKKQGPIGSWALLAGVIIAVIAGLISTEISGTVAAILVVLGIIVGLLNITAKEAKPFMLAVIALLLASFIGGDVLKAVPVVNLFNVLQAIIALIVPATILVAIREAFTIAK
jgi:hypothetical protein